MIQVGDRVVGAEGETGVVVEIGIAMRDGFGRRREAVKVDLDSDPRYPNLGPVKGAYRYIETVKVINPRD